MGYLSQTANAEAVRVVFGGRPPSDRMEVHLGEHPRRGQAGSVHALVSTPSASLRVGRTTPHGIKSPVGDSGVEASRPWPALMTYLPRSECRPLRSLVRPSLPESSS